MPTLMSCVFLSIIAFNNELFFFFVTVGCIVLLDISLCYLFLRHFIYIVFMI